MRESGWYRVKISVTKKAELAKYLSEKDCWIVTNYDGEWDDDEFAYIDPQMIMTPEGELVYHKAEHDPLYNTQQDG